VIYPYKHLLTLFSITFSDERQTMETQNSYSAERKPYSHPKVRGTSVISIRRSEKTGKFLALSFLGSAAYAVIDLLEQLELIWSHRRSLDESHSYRL
jgi:hypothetical protein